MSTQANLNRLELSTLIPVVINRDILEKIQYFCMSIAKDEWSGVLFYEVIGTITKPSKMRIIIKDILLMDRGTKTYTSFDWDEDVVQYKMDNMDKGAMDWSLGHIHSHNSMDVFFSGTDWGELNDNCANFSYYLSIIVNNYTEIVGKIALFSKPVCPKLVTKTFVCKDEKNENYEFPVTVEGVQEKPYLITMDCDIKLPFKKKNAIVELDTRIGEVYKKIEDKKKKEAAEKAALAAAAASKNFTQPNYGNNHLPAPKNMTPNYQSWDDMPIKQPIKGDDGWGSGSWNKYEFGGMSGAKKDWEMALDITQEEAFTCFILRLGNLIPDDKLEDALIDVNMSALNENALISGIVTNYNGMYKSFFDGNPQLGTFEHYESTIKEVMRLFKLKQDEVSFLETIVDGLKKLSYKAVTIVNQLQNAI